MPSEIPLVRVHPRRSILIMAIVSLAAALVPVTAMLALLAIAGGSWVTAAVVEVAAIAVCVLLGFRQLSLFTSVTATALEGNGFMTPTLRVPLSEIRSVHLVDTYVGQSSETITQLLVLDESGRRLFRLRGNFWTADALERVAAALPVAARRGEEPISLARFFADFPGSEYWFENKPWLKVVGIVAGAAAMVAAVMWVMTVLGHPVA